MPESGIKDLGIHTEMLTDGIIDLYRAGRVIGNRKKLNPGKMVCAFALGSRYLYDAIDHNPDIDFQPVDHTNQPHIIMQNGCVVAINNPTQVDLQGQATSESDGHRHSAGQADNCSLCAGLVRRRVEKHSPASHRHTTREANGAAGSCRV